MTAVTSAPASGAFGVALYTARVERGLSQARLAQLISHDHASISRLESGSRNPSRETVTRLADALELDGPDRVLFYAAAGLLEHGESVNRMLAHYIDYSAEEWLKLPLEGAA